MSDFRDRADYEKGFDELTHQWGWGCYISQGLERCNLSAGAVALIYIWWTWHVPWPILRRAGQPSLAARCCSPGSPA